jgi:hypothetical protein
MSPRSTSISCGSSSSRVRRSQAPQSRDARVRAHGQRQAARRRVDHHGAELVDAEQAPVAADPFLAEEHRAG